MNLTVISTEHNSSTYCAVALGLTQKSPKISLQWAGWTSNQRASILGPIMCSLILAGIWLKAALPRNIPFISENVIICYSGPHFRYWAVSGFFWDDKFIIWTVRDLFSAGSVPCIFPFLINQWCQLTSLVIMQPFFMCNGSLPLLGTHRKVLTDVNWGVQVRSCPGQNSFITT